MKISKTITIPANQYASQGNAILGIRDSGKTYTATYLAEQLMLENIPIVAFDPIGVWRFLKNGKNGKGFPIVVAGGLNGDLPLNPENAPAIVRAAMRENVSLVIDLYSMELSKSDWKKIVQQCIRVLLYENKDHGLRHIFIEEAAEFCPQRVRPEEGMVYAEIEKLARMGGNASLGYTLINQRPEEVNKAVLELCDCLFLHKQKGRHSITALGKWLEITDTQNAKAITNSLPSLFQGECWAWLQGSHNPERIIIPEKQTVHPDRKNPDVIAKSIPADVSPFVARMKKLLVKEPVINKNAADNRLNSKNHDNSVFGKVGTSRSDYSDINDKQVISRSSRSNSQEIKLNEMDKNLIADLELKVEALEIDLKKEKALHIASEKKLDEVKKLMEPQYKQLCKLFDAIGITDDSNYEDVSKWNVWLEKIGTGKRRKMLETMIQYKRLTRQRLALITGMSANSGSFNTYIGKLTGLKLIKREGDEYVLQSM